MSRRRRALIVSLLTLVPFGTGIGAAQANVVHHATQTAHQAGASAPWQWLCLDHYEINLMVIPAITTQHICLPNNGG